MANGSRHSMYLVPEATYGVTPNTPNMAYYRHDSTTLALAKNSLQSDEIRSDRQLVDFRLGTQQAAGNVVCELSYGSFDPVLEALLGGTWAANILNVGTTRRSFSIFRSFEDLGGAAPNNKSIQQYTGMEANTLELAVSTEAITKMTVGWIGKQMALAATMPTGAVLGTASTTLGMDSFTGSIKENGQAIAVITEISLKLENGIEPRYVVGSKSSIRPSSGRSLVTGQITAWFEDSYLLDKFVQEQSSSIEFVLTDGEGGNSYKFVIPRIKYTGGNTDTSGEGSVTITMPFQATYDPTAKTNLSITRIPKAGA